MTAVFDVPLTVALNNCVADAGTLTLAGLMLRTTAAAIVRLADADLAGFATLVAVTVTEGGDGTLDGAT